MSLEDDLSELVRAPEMVWREKREMIRNRFAKAANHLNGEAGDRWKVVLVNGNVALRLHDDDEVYELLFSKDESPRKAICEATRSDSSGVDAIEGIMESFDLDKLTESEVEGKIKEFVTRLPSDCL